MINDEVIENIVPQELDGAIIQQVELQLDQLNSEGAAKLLQNFHSADIARLVTGLSQQHGIELILSLPLITGCT